MNQIGRREGATTQIGIGLPATIPGVTGDLVLDWARRADEGPFSSLGIIDRLVYNNYEPLITLAAAGAVTRRVRLMSTVLIAPLRNAGVLAKQAASLDALSGGRLTLGLGVGGREDDFRIASAPFHGRGRRFERQLALMKRIWSGEPPDAGAGAVGPKPVRLGGPELLIGGYTPVAVQRVGRWADGYISGGGGDPARARQLYDMAHESWKAEGRPGRPRFVGAAYFALGPDAPDRAAAYIRDYYAFIGPMAEYLVRTILASADAIRGSVRACADAGMDELVFWPCVPEIDQVDRLADLAA